MKRGKKSTHPESTSEKSDHATPKARFLPLWRDTFIDAFPQPHIRLHIPSIQEDLEVGREFDRHHFDVGSTSPLSSTSRIDRGESQPGEDRRPFCQSPNRIILAPLNRSTKLEERNPIQNP